MIPVRKKPQYYQVTDRTIKKEMIILAETRTQAITKAKQKIKDKFNISAFKSDFWVVTKITKYNGRKKIM